MYCRVTSSSTSAIYSDIHPETAKQIDNLPGGLLESLDLFPPQSPDVKLKVT